MGKRHAKYVYIDCETTGLNPVKNDIWELAFIVDINGKVEYEEVLEIQPFNGDHLDVDALKLTRMTPEKLNDLEFTVYEAVEKIKDIWGRYIDKFNRDDKFVVGGYFVKFDLDFLREMFKKAGDRYGIGSWMFTPPIEVSTVVAQHIAEFGLRLPNYKLATVCEHYGIDIEAHQALSDIRATRELYYLLEGLV